MSYHIMEFRHDIAIVCHDYRGIPIIRTMDFHCVSSDPSGNDTRCTIPYSGLFLKKKILNKWSRFKFQRINFVHYGEFEN